VVVVVAAWDRPVAVRAADRQDRGARLGAGDKSEIGNRKSEIGNRRSEIGDRQSLANRPLAMAHRVYP
jgi:hypothetical protein